MYLYVTGQKHNLSPKYWKLKYWNMPKLSQVAETSQRKANIHCMLDILMSRSNNEVHIYEINESVTERKI